ncbi:MAG TPA: ATP-binding cassette domain-containing protein [Micromonosporaceae bacterium]|nr:ATP-binding cassette domain-containing protein [Micromonosporaceae bacterium]
MRFDDVWLRYGKREPWVLEAVDLTIAPGEVAIVVGHNGVGKSTLLQLAVGVLAPSRGAVRDRPSVVGWVPERFPAEQPFTARRYLRYMGAARGLSTARVSATIDRWAERLLLTPYLDARLTTLSKGTAQKVGLIQALLAPPSLLVLDEPWEGLDAHTRSQVPAMVAEVVARGGSVLVSDHRGETARLPGATRWLVEDGTVSAGPSEASAPAGEWVVEVAVAAASPAAAADRLRADGHRVLAVRPEQAS